MANRIIAEMRAKEENGGMKAPGMHRPADERGSAGAAGRLQNPAVSPSSAGRPQRSEAEKRFGHLLAGRAFSTAARAPAAPLIAPLHRNKFFHRSAVHQHLPGGIPGERRLKYRHPDPPLLKPALKIGENRPKRRIPFRVPGRRRPSPFDQQIVLHAVLLTGRPAAAGPPALQSPAGDRMRSSAPLRRRSPIPARVPFAPVRRGSRAPVPPQS